MFLTPEVKKEIDDMTVYQLLQRWRFSPVGDAMFEGESGDYYKQKLKKLREELPEVYTNTSKRIGW